MIADLNQLMSQFQIYVKGFSRSTGEQQLKKLFSANGEVKEVRIIRDYAFIVFNNADDVDKAVEAMNDTSFGDYKLKVQVAGKPKRARGPQSNDECRQCGRLGHWKNDCPESRGNDSRRRRRRSYSSSSSSSQSSSSDRKHRKKHKSKKISKKHRKRSSSSSGSSSSRSISSQQKLREKNKKEKKGNE